MLDLFGPTVGAGGVTVRPSDGRAFTATDTFFKDCSTPDLDDGTEFQAAWFNVVAAVLRAVARGNGQTAAATDVVGQDNADDAILLKAIQHLIQRGQIVYADDVGTANNIVAAFSPPLSEYKKGMVFYVKMAAAPTGAAVANFNALGNKPVIKAGGNPLQGNEWQPGDVVPLHYDGTSLQVAVVAPGIVVSGRLVRQTSGSFSFTAAATCWHKITLDGAGGGGGGGQSTGVGAGASGGGRVIDYVFLIKGQSYSYTVGLGGAGGAPGFTGTGGGSTSFAGPNGTVVATGGNPGGGAGAGSAATNTASVSGSGLSPLGHANFSGYGYQGAPQISQAGQGGSGASGGAGGQASFGGGNPGTQPGGGGSGSTNPTGTTQSGGTGGNGQFMIEW